MNEITFKNGDILPKIGIGTWLSKPEEVYNAILEAIKAGYRHIDCAYIYKNEKEIGDALDFAFKSGLVKREELFITSKLWNNDHKKQSVEPAIKRTLENLRIDYLDLYLMHWPIAFKSEHEQAKEPAHLATLEEISLEETWLAMAKLKNKGYTKHIGVSNFNMNKLLKLIATGIQPENNQIELHPYFQQPELVEFCKNQEITLTAYSPLGSRHLIKTEAAINENPIIKLLAEKYNCSPTQVILAWGIKRGISVIPKSVHQQRIIDNYGAINIELSIEDYQTINNLDQNNRQSKGLYAVLPGGYYTYESIWNE